MARATKKTAKSPTESRSGLLSLTLVDLSALHLSYMPFVINGGLFIPTERKYSLGDEVFVRLTLMDEPEQIPVPGRVVWLTVGAGTRQGIGIQFLGGAEALKTKIETRLAGVDTEKETWTM